MLPPLETLIDSAIANNPNVKFRDLQIDVNKHKLKDDKLMWTRNLGIQTDVRYGTFDNFSTNTAEGQSPSILAYRSNQLNYGVGGYIKLPLYDFISRKNQINLAKAEIEQAQSMAESQRNEVRQFVIKQYNELILSQRLLKNKTHAIETSRINLQMTEKEFKSGIISVGEYTRIYQIVCNEEADLETAKMDFITAYMMLEELIGYKLNIKYNPEKQANESN